jgi:acylphosphatase
VAVVVSGTVQGVFFRSAIEERARRLGLSGWVRNLPDGRVGAEFQGPADAVDQVVAFCRRGPSQAHVENIEVRELEAVPQAGGFAVK